MRPEQSRTYDRTGSVVFLKTDEPFGGLSNMAGGFPLRVNEMRILSSEALYQACRFPHRPELQRLIIEQKSPMTAKMKSKPYRRDSRQDWDQVRVNIMRWCLRVKLAQNWCKFSELLLETGTRPIVEESRKDDFWGAKEADDGSLVGMNVLGRLLMELREALKAESRESLMRVQPIAIPEFLLDGRTIGIITAMDTERDVPPMQAEAMPLRSDAGERPVAQPSLFDGPAVKEASSPAYAGVNATRIRIPDLRPYREYKGSGLPWLGDIPQHWAHERAKWLFTKMDRPVGEEDEVVTCFRDGMVTLRKNRRLRGFTEATVYSGYQGIRKGDLVIHGMDAFAGAIGVSDSDGKGTPVYNVCLPRPGANASYYAHLVRWMSQSQWILALAKGIRERSTDFRFEMFGDQRVPLPPPDEQAAIVRFLDWANGRLERAIRAKRDVITLLNEQKQAIIHRAVTHGLDPSVPLKPSGIPWLGEIPQHWEVMRVKRTCSLVRDGTHLPPARTQTGFPLLSVRNMMGDRLVRRSDDSFISNADFEQLNSSFIVRPNDVLMAIVGATLGKVAVVEDIGPFQIQRSVSILRPRSAVMSPAFLATFLRSPRLQQHLWQSVAFSAQPGIYLGFVGNIPVPVPPTIAEQVSICGGLQRELSPIDTAISRLEREIELLREYRTRLVADVVTGKLDVREAAARLPEEAPPDTMEDDADLSDEVEADDEEAVA